jgi:hypothetical protein
MKVCGAPHRLENTSASNGNSELAWYPSKDVVYQQQGMRNFLRVNDETHEEDRSFTLTLQALSQSDVNNLLS